jgi:hypothetical protein
MRELTPETITAAVLDHMAATPDPRLKTIMESAVTHLHPFAPRGQSHARGIDQGDAEHQLRHAAFARKRCRSGRYHETASEACTSGADD